MTSARIRGWGSYFSKKVDDAFSSLIPTPPQSNQQEADRLEANPQEPDEHRQNQEAQRRGQELANICTRPLRQNQEAQRRGQELANICTRPLRLYAYIIWVWVIIVWVVVITFIIIRST